MVSSVGEEDNDNNCFRNFNKIKNILIIDIYIKW